MPKNSADFTVSANSAFAGTLAFAECIVGKTTGTSELSLTPNPGDPSRPKWRVRGKGRTKGTKFTATFRKRRVGAKLGSRVTRKK